MELKYCQNCIMDGSAEELTLDENGICNFCDIAQEEIALAKMNRMFLDDSIDHIKTQARKYDVLIGLSGGADSSTVLHHAVKMGLRPLCFTFDNGWGESLADKNIKKMVDKLNVPLIEVKVDKDKYAELQNAFLKAGVPNIEIPTDHILMALTYKMAAKHDITFVLSGGNAATESIMPPSWGYNARDLKHIKDIYKKMTGKRLKGLPVCGIWKWNYYRWVLGIKVFYLLDYMDYNRADSIKMLGEEYGWEDYYEKHCESTWTWWFQSYYLFHKFKIDKRKAHLSSLINSGQMTKSEALERIALCPEYPELGIEEKVMKYPRRKHEEFKMGKGYERIAKIVKYVAM